MLPTRTRSCAFVTIHIPQSGLARRSTFLTFQDWAITSIGRARSPLVETVRSFSFL